MDFKKIEWIFFLAFLGLNLFLLNLYREARIEQNITYRTNETIPLKQRLASENIKYEEDFSEENQMGYYLSGVPTDFYEARKEAQVRLNIPDFLMSRTTIEEGMLTHLIDEPIYIQEATQVETIITALLNDENFLLYGDSYQYLPQESNLMSEYPEIIAGQEYEGIAINDSSSRLIFSLEKLGDRFLVKKYSQTHISDLSPLREEMAIISEKEAINTLYINSKIPSNSKIISRELMYKMTIKIRGQNIYVPTWFVTIETTDGKVRVEQVNGFTNRIVTNSIVQTVENK